MGYGIPFKGFSGNAFFVHLHGWAGWSEIYLHKVHFVFAPIQIILFIRGYQITKIKVDCRVIKRDAVGSSRFPCLAHKQFAANCGQ